MIQTYVRINIWNQCIWIFKYISYTLPKTYSCYTIKFRPTLCLILFMHKNIRQINVLHLGKKYFMILGVCSLFQIIIRFRFFLDLFIILSFKIYKENLIFQILMKVQAIGCTDVSRPGGKHLDFFGATQLINYFR